MSEIIFYTNPMSRGRIVRWMLEELGQPYETKVLDYGPQMKSPDYLAINPMGKVPTVQHGHAVVTEAAVVHVHRRQRIFFSRSKQVRRDRPHRWLPCRAI